MTIKERLMKIEVTIKNHGKLLYILIALQLGITGLEKLGMLI